VQNIGPEVLVQVTNHEHREVLGAMLSREEARTLASQLERAAGRQPTPRPEDAFDTGSMLDELSVTHSAQRRSRA